MAVVSYREVVGRTLSHSFGESPSAERKFVATLDSPNTSTQEVIDTVGIGHLSSHPEYGYLKMTTASVSEGSPSPFHVELTYEYTVPDGDDPAANPLARPDIWSFSTSGAAVPAYYYYENNATPRVLVNSANDFFEGAQTEEAEVRATIQANRSSFPLNLAVQATNCVNSDAFLGADPYHWKCAGISAQQVREIVDETEIKYWQITSELVFRQSGWPLQLPDVGYNYLDEGVKKRAYVIDPEDDVTKIPCASPIGLNEDGSIRETGTPRILIRRVHKEIAFFPLFGNPPT